MGGGVGTIKHQKGEGKEEEDEKGEGFEGGRQAKRRVGTLELLPQVIRRTLVHSICPPSTSVTPGYPSGLVSDPAPNRDRRPRLTVRRLEGRRNVPPRSAR